MITRFREIKGKTVNKVTTHLLTNLDSKVVWTSGGVGVSDGDGNGGSDTFKLWYLCGWQLRRDAIVDNPPLNSSTSLLEI